MAKYNCVGTLCDAGISYEDATALRRISMTLHRWHELECGDGNSYGSWCITRGKRQTLSIAAHEAAGETKINTLRQFVHDDDGAPYIEHHHYTHGQGKDSVSYAAIPDRERGALKRLAKIMANYPGWASYVQGDPRGCALYILRPADTADLPDNPNGGDVDVSSVYTRGIAVCR